MYMEPVYYWRHIVLKNSPKTESKELMVYKV